MHMPIVLALVAIQCTLCLSIRVPVDWTDDSEVDRSEQLINAVKHEQPNENKLNEYFQYPARKPQFAVDIAKAHGAQSPEKLFRPHPIQPHTGLPKPQLGHRVNPEKIVVQPYRGFVQSAGGSNYAKPATTSFEVYHPYKSEEPALQQLYKDPNLDKIRNDLRDNHRKLQKYQNEAGKPVVTKGEYLERPEEIDRRKLPHKSIPVQYEVHRPERRPVYYRYPPKQNHREHLVSQKLRHPWNQNIAKVTPIHYRPIKNHLHGLRQQHALKFDDERNEYPQLPPQDDEEESEGYDIFQKGKARFVQLRNNVDDSINKVLQENRPHNGQKLELQEGEDDHHLSSEVSDEQNFVPVKNYAQVRKTEVTKHLPREAALQDAESLEEILNAPRLREAIKSKKAQIVYSEEGYEDSGYDHAGEQKHASENENHGGYLKQDAVSQGKYKTPTISVQRGSKKGSKHGNEIDHDEKWNNDIKENEEEDESDYYESEEGTSDINDITEDNDENSRNKRNSEVINTNSESEKSAINERPHENSNLKNKREALSSHDVTKRQTLTQNKTLEKVSNDSNIKKKYPYYFQNLKLLSKNSPIRYAENFKLIPKKSNGGTEFYDSRSKLECPEVEDDVDALPDKLKKEGHPDESIENLSEEAKDEVKFSTLENKQRLKGLGDKIDCFKVKYFGENPLDSPFFAEDFIDNPEPVTKPSLEIFKNMQGKKLTKDELLTQNSDIFIALDKLRKDQSDSSSPNVTVNLNKNKNDSQNGNEFNSNFTSLLPNSINISFTHVRNKRATPFTYEPYKIIRDSQIPESKKTTTTSNISPLIKQLQSSRVIDKVTNHDKDQALKKNNTKVYKTIGKGDRPEHRNDSSNDTFVPIFVDVNSDLRRGEPKYEIKPVSRISNHKSQYSPVENKKAISLTDYKAQTANIEFSTQSQLKRSKRRKPTVRPFFDVSQFLPKSIDSQTAASNTVRRIIRTTTAVSPTTERIKRHKVRQSNSSDKEYQEYINKEEDKIKTTTTVKPAVQKRTRGTTTTPKSAKIEDDTESHKLRLITRFRDYEPNEKPIISYDTTANPSITSYDNERSSPKYTEKKKKSTKSTLVTDTKSYGEGDDSDMRKEEVDDLIGVKHDTEEYIPLYERVVNKINRMKIEDLNKKREYDSDVNIYGDNTSEDRFHFSDDDDEEDEEDDDDGDVSSDENDDDEEEDEVEEKEEEETEINTDNKEKLLELTTSEPTKRTLDKTTEAPATTTESRSAKLQLKPIISKKKVEIHKELPVNKSSPHVTQFKQDIKEIEIVKQLTPKPKKKSNKNAEALDLFRDEKLAEEVNKLGDVEVFRENLDLNSGPKHGGNYRSITSEELEKESRDVNNKGDVETSQSETKKFIEVNKDAPSRRRGSYSGRSSPQKNDSERSAKFVELGDTYDSKPRLHGGNLKLPQSRDSRRNSKSERYVEIDEDEEEEPTSMHGGNLKPYEISRNSGRRMHGGNYRSAKLVKADESEEKPAQTRSKSKVRGNSAALLNGYARAVPVLTTTPGYILDPSKRMYYYVDA